MYWWLLDDIALTAAALIIMINLLFLEWLTYHEPKPTQPSYTLKPSQMPKSQWIKAYLKLLKDTTDHWISEWTTTTKGPRSK